MSEDTWIYILICFVVSLPALVLAIKDAATTIQRRRDEQERVCQD